MIDTDKYEGHTENKWEWYEFGDGDWILCPLFDGVKANEDDMWWVDENGEHINDSQDIFNWDESILVHLKSEQLPHKRADMNLIQDAPLLLAEVSGCTERSTSLRHTSGSAITWDTMNCVVRSTAWALITTRYRGLIRNGKNHYPPLGVLHTMTDTNAHNLKIKIETDESIYYWEYLEA